MLYRTLPIVLAALAVVCLLSQPAVAAEKIHEGVLVKAGGGKLTMTDKTGKNQVTHAVAPDAKISCDGKACKLEDLKDGCTLKVTFNDDAKKTATKIEARSRTKG